LRIAALILGILGGLIGLGWAIITLAVKISEINSFTEYGMQDFAFVWVCLTVALLSMVGLIGGALALTAPKPASVLMLIPASVFIAAGVLGFHAGAMSMMAIVFIPLLVGGILACVSQRRSTRQS
jgi:hypothetical protein